MTTPRATSNDLRYAYRLLLGREPDAAGFASLKHQIKQSKANVTDVAALFFGSTEFKRLQAAPPVLDEVIFEGLKIYPWRGDSLIGNLVKTRGEYEARVLPLFVESIPQGGTVLDVGANIGIYTLSAARKVGVDGRVFAVEPVAKNVQSLCAGVVGNGFRNVSILPVAASAQAGVVPMLRHANSSNGIVDVHADPALADAFAPSQQIDFLLNGLDRLDVIKVDIEGHEPVVWPSLDALVRKHRPLVFTEFNPTAIRNHSRTDPALYLHALFTIAATLEVLHLDGRRILCATPDEVMQQWRDANARMRSVEDYHLDLIVDARVR